MTSPFRDDDTAMAARRNALERTLHDLDRQRGALARELAAARAELAGELRSDGKSARSSRLRRARQVVAALLIFGAGAASARWSRPGMSSVPSASEVPASAERSSGSAFLQAVQKSKFFDHIAIDTPPAAGDPCPSSASVRGVIATTVPTPVLYRWERSDRRLDPVDTNTIYVDRGHPAVISASWDAPSAGRMVRGNARLHVLYPEDYLSEPTSIAFLCG